MLANKSLIILRGLPGSGKSTLGQLISRVCLSADDYFTDPETGVYTFEPGRLKEAHKLCVDGCKWHMENEEPTIVIANTSTQEWEMEKYEELAKQCQYRVFHVIVENRHGSENVHGCPEDKILQMLERFSIKLK